MRRFALLLLVFFSCLGLAQWQGKKGSSASLTIDYAGLNQVSSFSLKSTPAIKGELLIDLHYRGKDGPPSSKLLRPLVNGTHSFNYRFSKTGDWGIWMRYGIGIDSYQDYLRFTVPETATIKIYPLFFEGALSSNVASYVQPLGFTLFAVLLGISALVLVFTFRWIGKKRNLSQDSLL